MDSPAPLQCATAPGARQHPRRDEEIDDAEVSSWASRLKIAEHAIGIDADCAVNGGRKSCWNPVISLTKLVIYMRFHCQSVLDTVTAWRRDVPIQGIYA